MRLTTPHSRTRRTVRSASLAALLALTGATALVAAPTASAATTASLTANVPMAARGAGMSVVYFGTLRIDDGTSVTCLGARDADVSGGNGRIILATDYKITTGATYNISAWEGGNCGSGGGMQSLGGVTVKPTAADVSNGTYTVSIP
ncbi:MULTISPECIES: hypothetical protein [unclassified Streptomyces]|uniref:hypothetical protein n=1 Tax=unclassified Streptomyces TaxID=2593676 RepID=UPI002E7A1C38|nr:MULTISPECIES: hypothetical protein [unclassified Streptomyces]MEE1761732.1 hypothetical protein [Streptomyces sp. SP18BB07]MEE1835230.1 hypothetical protein [Streptomyces sp. SP17KL33]